MKKSFILITLLLITTTLFAQYPGLKWKIFNLDNIPDATFALKPAKFLDGGKTIWLAGHSTSAPYTTVTWRSTDGGETWLKGTPIPVTTNGARFGAIEAVDANIAFLALVNGHIYKTTDAGLTWRDVHSYVAGGNEWFGGIKALSNNVVVAMGDGDVAGHYYVCRSTNLGETWTQIPYDNLPNAGAQLSVFTWGTIFDSYGDNLWMALYQSNTQTDFPVVRSTDAGLTWEVSRVLSTSRLWVISFINDKVGMTVNQGGTVFITTDGGVNWDTLRTAPPALTANPRRTITAVRDKNKFFLFEESDDALPTQRSHSIYQTSDNGKTWIKDFVPFTEMATRTSVDNLSISVYDDNLGFAFSRNNIKYKIGDLEVKEDLNIAIRMEEWIYKPGAILNNGNTIWFCGHEATGNRNTYSFVSTDAGKTFKKGARVTGRTSNIVAYDANVALMATADGWIVRTTDGGSSWTQVFHGGGGEFFNGIQLIGPNIVVAYGDGTSDGNPYFCKSTDKGLTFTEIPREQLPKDLGVTRYGYQVNGSCTDSYKNHAWFSLYGAQSEYSYVVRTSDYGETWESGRLDILGNAGTTGRIRSLSWPTDKFGMAVTLNNEIFVMENAGDLWYKTNHPSVNYPSDTITIANVTGIPETRTFIAGGIVRSGGSVYYAAYISHDLGHSWKQIVAPYSSGTSSYIQSGLYFNENMGYALTYDGPILKLGNENIYAIYVKELDEGLSVPKAYTLEQNYPNPFNPSTTIRFTLNKKEHVNLVIYDALGKEVRTLVYNNISAGEYSLVFDAVGLSSGVYFYTLRVGNALETKKMVLMK